VDKPTGKIDVIEFVDVRVLKQGDGARSPAKSSSPRATSPARPCRSSSARRTTTFRRSPKVVQSPQEGRLEPFSLDIPRANLQRKTKVTIEAKITGAQRAAVATGGIYIGKGTSVPLIIGTMRRLRSSRRPTACSAKCSRT